MVGSALLDGGGSRDEESGLRMVLLEHHESGATDTDAGAESDQLDAEKTSDIMFSELPAVGDIMFSELPAVGDVRLAHEFQLLPLVDAEPVCLQGLRRTLTHHAQVHASLGADCSEVHS